MNGQTFNRQSKTASEIMALAIKSQEEFLEAQESESLLSVLALPNIRSEEPS